MKRNCRVLLALVLLAALLAGCTGGAGNPALFGVPKTKPVLVGDLPVEFPLAKEPTQLNIMITSFNGMPQDDVLVWKKYQEMTGVSVNWTTVTKDTRSEAYHTALTNKQQYDLILRCKVSGTKLLRYGKSGLILDLAKDGLLQENAPNCWAYLQSHPDALASVMNPDGSIYALPQVNAGAELRVGIKIFVNKTWLDKVSKPLPTTTKELRDLLTAFKQLDANGNGDPSDEIPLCIEWAGLRTTLLGAFGLENRGMHNETMDADPKTGNVRMIESSEPYKGFLEYVNGLYADELLDRNLFDMTTEQIVGNVVSDKVGVIAMTNLALLPADKASNWVAIEEALTGPYGDKLWSGIRANFHSTGAALLPATCSDPALVLRWLDYFWTDEGTLFYHMGVEGETYTALEDGTYDYLPKIYEEMHEKNLSFDEIVSEYSPYPGGSNPTVEIAPYFMGGEMAPIPAAAARSLIEYGPEEYWPSFTFTQEESDKLNEINGDLSKYCNSMCIDFITGARPFTEWEAYLAQINSMGADQKISIYQAAVDRYHALLTALN